MSHNCDKLRTAVDMLEDACRDLTRLCKRIEDSRPEDDPHKYPTVEAFESAWNKHYRFIDDHQQCAHKYDKAVMAVETALSEVQMPMFGLA